MRKRSCSSTDSSGNAAPSLRPCNSYRLLVLCETALTEAQVGDRLEQCLPAGGRMVEFFARHLRTRAARLRLATCMRGWAGMRVALVRRLERLTPRELALAGVWLRTRGAAADWIVLTVHAPRSRQDSRRKALRVCASLGIDAVVELDGAPMT